MPTTHTAQCEFDIGDVAVFPPSTLLEDTDSGDAEQDVRRIRQLAAQAAGMQSTQYGDRSRETSSSQGSSTPYSLPSLLPEGAVTDVEAGEDVQGSTVSYRNPERVIDYLERHPKAVGFISRAWVALIRAFEGPVDVVLEVISYPEEQARDELVGWIQSTDDVYEGLEKLERFEDEWFLDHLPENDYRFNFNIETK